MITLYHLLQGTYNCIPATDHVSRVYSFAFILYFQFMLHETLFYMLNVLYINTFRGMCAVSSVAGFFLIVSLFCAFPLCLSGIF
jgi:hypothetical protein